jgi:peptidoglycan/LPS O-acetylase OafA/YrhL
MDSDRIFTGLENLLSILHIAILILSALVFMFVFIINWEDWFFDVRLAGPAAGLFLAAKAAGAVVLVFMVTQYPDRWKAVLPASIAYFGFLFVNATLTYQITAPGSFPVLLAVLVIIPGLLLVLKLRSTGFKKNRNNA